MIITRVFGLLSFFIALALPTVAPARDVTVILSLPGDPGRVAHTVVMIAEPVLGTLQTFDPPLEEVRRKATVPGDLQLDLNATVSWQIRAEAEDLWSSERLLLPGATALNLALLPMVTLTSKLDIAAGELPSNLFASFRSLPTREGDDDAIDADVSCTPDDHTWSCRLPVGTWDVRFHVPGFVSHFFWGLEISEPFDLGSLKLERGATLFGRLATEDGQPIDNATSRVEAVPLIDSRADVATRERNVARLVARLPGERPGFYQLAGLAPGLYEVIAHQEGYLPARQRALLVEEGAELEVDALTLRRPLDMQIVIHPATDFGSTWKLMLLKLDTWQAVSAGAADAQGRWAKGGLASGRYLLYVADATGARMAEEMLDLETDQTSFEIEIPITWIDGEVRIGDEPLAASVVFGSVSGGVSIAIDSDEEGRFAGRLPRSGAWQVDVQADDPKVFRRFASIEIETDAAGAAKPVVLELPDTYLAGEVVDEQGEPQTMARVLVQPLSSREKLSYLATDEDGTFLLRGYASGSYRLEARLEGEEGTLLSEPVEVEIPKSTKSASVHLVVRQMRTLRGRVVDGSGRGVAGATLLVTGAERSTNLVLPKEQTGIDGRFVIEVSSNLRRAHVFVLASGYLLEQLDVDLDTIGNTAMEVGLVPGSQGGDVILRFPEHDGERRRLWLQLPGEQPLHFGILAMWARMNGVLPSLDEMRVPSLSPGNYTVCWGAEASKKPDCQEAVLGIAEQLTFDLQETTK